MIALIGSYNDGCKRQHIIWSIAKTWSRLSKHRVVHMTVHIHVPKEKRLKLKPYGKKGTFTGYKVSHMDIDCKEKKALNMIIQIPLV